MAKRKRKKRRSKSTGKTYCPRCCQPIGTRTAPGICSIHGTAGLPWSQASRPTHELVEGRKARYEAYMQSAQWRRTRLRIIEREAGRCAMCSGPGKDVHHLTYERLGKEDDLDLVLLCGRCHSLQHRNKAME